MAALKERLLRSGPRRWAKAKQLLSWLICAHRPLKWHEIQAIISFDPDAESIDFDSNMIRSDITDLLGSLVQVLPGDNIRLIHNSAKEYVPRSSCRPESSLVADYLSTDTSSKQRTSTPGRSNATSQSSACATSPSAASSPTTTTKPSASSTYQRATSPSRTTPWRSGTSTSTP